MNTNGIINNENDRNLLNKVGIALSIPGILNTLLIYIPLILATINIYIGDSYFIILLLLLAFPILFISIVLIIAWGVCVYIKKVKYNVSLSKYKVAFIFLSVDIALYLILLIPALLNFIGKNI